MSPNDELIIISDLRKAKKCTANNVRCLIRRKKLMSLPKLVKRKFDRLNLQN